jgi:uncharacterized protein (DUF1684 family)
VGRVDAFDIADWRRRVFALYAQVRAASDPVAGHALWRAGRDALFATHPASPLPDADRAGFDGLPVAGYDPAWRFDAEVRPGDGEAWEAATGTDGTVVFERFGVAELPGVGTLDVWRLTSYGGGLFVPVRDPGPSYGGGRYVVDTVKGADLGLGDGRVVIDLNFAYNPSCAYDPAWACPLAPLGNRLDVPVPVGELAS